MKEKAKQPVIMKLSPNVTDIADHGEGGGGRRRGCTQSLINTLTGMKFDIHRRNICAREQDRRHVRPLREAGRRAHGISGSACGEAFPSSAWAASQNAEDAIEFLLAGATAVSVGTANFHNPFTTVEVVDGITDYMRVHGMEDVKEIFLAE